MSAQPARIGTSFAVPAEKLATLAALQDNYEEEYSAEERAFIEDDDAIGDLMATAEDCGWLNETMSLIATGYVQVWTHDQCKRRLLDIQDALHRAACLLAAKSGRGHVQAGREAIE